MDKVWDILCSALSIEGKGQAPALHGWCGAPLTADDVSCEEQQSVLFHFRAWGGMGKGGSGVGEL